MLRRGADVNDRDGLTDNTLLHYACKSGAGGLGRQAWSAKAVERLIKEGANPNQRCRWTDMTPVHTAAFFGFSEGLSAMLRGKTKVQVDMACREFDGATALHMAAMAGAPEAVEALISHGADARARDNNQRTAADCARVVAASQAMGDFEATERWERIASVLASAAGSSMVGSEVGSTGVRGGGGGGGGGGSGAAGGRALRATSAAVTGHSSVRSPTKSRIPTAAAARAGVSPRAAKTRSADKFGVGSRCFVDGRVCVVRFMGRTQFSPGTWLGLEFEGPTGKNNGSVADKTYFTCPDNHGLFVRPNRATWRGISVASVIGDR